MDVVLQGCKGLHACINCSGSSASALTESTVLVSVASDLGFRPRVVCFIAFCERRIQKR